MGRDGWDITFGLGIAPLALSGGLVPVRSRYVVPSGIEEVDAYLDISNREPVTTVDVRANGFARFARGRFFLDVAGEVAAGGHRTSNFSVLSIEGGGGLYLGRKFGSANISVGGLALHRYVSSEISEGDAGLLGGEFQHSNWSGAASVKMDFPFSDSEWSLFFEGNFYLLDLDAPKYDGLQAWSAAAGVLVRFGESPKPGPTVPVWPTAGEICNPGADTELALQIQALQEAREKFKKAGDGDSDCALSNVANLLAWLGSPPLSAEQRAKFPKACEDPFSSLKTSLELQKSAYSLMSSLPDESLPDGGCAVDRSRNILQTIFLDALENLEREAEFLRQNPETENVTRKLSDILELLELTVSDLEFDSMDDAMELIRTKINKMERVKKTSLDALLKDEASLARYRDRLDVFTKLCLDIYNLMVRDGSIYGSIDGVEGRISRLLNNRDALDRNLILYHRVSILASRAQQETSSENSSFDEGSSE